MQLRRGKNGNHLMTLNSLFLTQKPPVAFNEWFCRTEVYLLNQKYLLFYQRNSFSSFLCKEYYPYNSFLYGPHYIVPYAIG